MKHHIKQFISILFIFFFNYGFSQEKVQIKNTEVIEIQSEYVKGMNYHIHVALPEDYSQSRKDYPVVYYTDAFDWGGIVIETYRLLNFFNEVPPMILVGISYDLNEDNHLALRARDFTPTHIPVENLPEGLQPLTRLSGGADDFLDFIEKELIPTIEDMYRIDSTNRGLLGYSYGGLFNAYVLFKRPQLFQKHLIGAPALFWDDYYVFKEEENLFESNQVLSGKVFLAVGSDDGAHAISSWIALRDRLNERAYENLDFNYMIFDGENHTSAIPAIYSRAFRILYGNK